MCPLHDVHRFTVRDFQYNEEEMKADKEEMTRLSTDKKKQFVSSIVFFSSNVMYLFYFVFAVEVIEKSKDPNGLGCSSP